MGGIRECINVNWAGEAKSIQLWICMNDKISWNVITPVSKLYSGLGWLIDIKERCFISSTSRGSMFDGGDHVLLRNAVRARGLVIQRVDLVIHWVNGLMIT